MSHLAAPPARHGVAGGVELQVLLGRQPVVDPEEVRHVADQLAHTMGVVRDRDAGDRRHARIGQHQRRQDPDGGGLPRPVRPDEAEYLAPGHGELQPLEGRMRPVLFAQLLDGDHWPLTVSWESYGVVSWARARMMPPITSPGASAVV